MLDGRDIHDYSVRGYAKEVAYLPQHLPAATALTARELVMDGALCMERPFGAHQRCGQGGGRPSLPADAHRKFTGQIVDTLSGGERSRIWLAMCLAQQSRFLLLDEPLAALDIAHQIEVMALVQKLSRDLGLGVIIVIHDINLAAQYCDELVALKQGRLLKTGRPSEIMTAQVLKDIYSVEMNIIAHPENGRPVALP